MTWNFTEFFVFALTMTITPGPNNLLLLATSINHGVKKAFIPFFGIMFGFTILVTSCGMGIGALLQQYPYIQKVMLYAGASYLCYLGFKIARSHRVLKEGELRGKPEVGFWQAATLQLINPKAWTMGIMASTLFMPTGIPVWQGSLLLGTFTLIFFPCGLLWIFGGVGLRQLLRTPKHVKLMNFALGGLTIGLAVWLVLQ